jgi:hypothetical protein
MRDRALSAVVAAGVVGAALVAWAADQGTGTDGGPGAAKAASALQESVEGVTIPAASRPLPKQARVPAGVLVRAASRRAQERELASPHAAERRRARDQGDVILSVEIDWHASGAADR